jgi:signal transduction histidine kinase
VRLVPNEATLSSSVLVWESVGTPTGDFTVAVANPLSDLEQSLDTLEGILWIATPTLAAMVGIAVWLLVGRALRPVEAMRREVDDISATTLDRRIAVPDTDDEIARLARTMNTMLDRLEAASQAQLRFVSDASHELRSPVSSIRTELEVARRTDGTDWDAVSERVLREDERLAELIDDLLTLARLDEGATARREPVDLDDLVLEEAARTSRVPVRADAVTAARVEGDPRQLARMLRNLVDNATRHARSEVRPVLQCDDGVVVLDVHDDGSGVPPDDRERVFDRFTRLEPSRDRDLGGTGLGLTVVRAVAEAHGGTVHVDDSPLGGARFAVRLPAAT